MFICTTAQVEAVLPRVEEEITKLPKHSLRDETVSMLWSASKWGCNMTQQLALRKLHNLDVLVHYGTTQVHSRKPRTIMDVDKLVLEWVAAAVALSTAHTKEELDAAEYSLDEMLKPILAAPVKQLREFHEKLQIALRQHPRIPFFVWTAFNVWGKTTIDKCEDDESAKRLRGRLANEIAKLAEFDVRPDLAGAIAGALMWRDVDELKAIKEEIEQGAKPRLKGRESCLFLVTRRGRGRHAVERRIML